MKRKNAVMLGNVFMGIGIVLMVGGIALTIISQLPELNLPAYFTYFDLMAIFAGAMTWLVGARIGGREAVADRYWWVKHFDKRCLRQQPHS
ncbi:stress-induced protein YchH [Symbiopectobacterium purcellii]|uniref:stress-induced protein YchH n=1 Tax=Symbiopectobacterium purcellii TaxID=2871826 RepID=UPI003F86126A